MNHKKPGSNAQLLKLVIESFRAFDHKTQIRTLILLFLMAVLAFMEAFGAALIVSYVVLLNDPAQIAGNSILTKFYAPITPDKFDSLIIFASIGLLLFFLLKNTFSLWVQNSQFKLLYGKMPSVSSDMFCSYMNRSLIHHVNTNSSELIRNVTGEVNLYFTNFLIPTLTCISEILVLGAMVVVLLLIAPIPSMVAIGIIGGLAKIFYSLIRKSVSSYGKQAQTENTERIRWVNQAFHIFKESKIFNLEAFFIENFRRHEELFSASSRYAMLLNQTPRLFIESLALSVLFIGVAFALILGQDRTDVLPVLSLFAVAAVRLLPSANRIMQSLTRMAYYKHSAQVVLKQTDSRKAEQEEKKDTVTKVDWFDNWNQINFNNVSFKHENSKGLILDQVNIKLNRYESVALVGPSGSGKTSFADILLGLLNPSSGMVEVDGMNIAENLKSWQKQLAYIPQSIYLLDSDIRSNVALGQRIELIDDQQVWEALTRASIDEFVRTQSEGLNFRIGENGSKLSGGQRQRLGIARAFYRKPKLIVMDEATSALDEKTEHDIADTIERLSHECTFVVIAHRPDTIKRCQVIYRVDKGKVFA